VVTAGPGHQRVHGVGGWGQVWAAGAGPRPGPPPPPPPPPPWCGGVHITCVWLCASFPTTAMHPQGRLPPLTAMLGQLLHHLLPACLIKALPACQAATTHHDTACGMRRPRMVSPIS
jgi:hypothetical protein